LAGTDRGGPSGALLEPLLSSPTVQASPALEARLVDAERCAPDNITGALRLLEGEEARRPERSAAQPGVLLAAAGLLLQDAGWLTRSRESFHAAADAAGANGDVETLAVAALGLGGVWVHEHRSTFDRMQVTELQHRALADLDPSSAVALRLRVRIHVEQAYARGDTADLAALLDEVRALDAPVVLAEALSTVHHCLLGPEHSDVRLRLAEELIAVSGRTGRRMHVLFGLTWRTVDLFLAGDPHAARSLRELRARADVAQVACVAYVVAALDVMLAIRTGRLQQAELLAKRCLDLGVAVGDADATGWYGAHVVAIRWYQGRGGEVLDLLADLADSPTMAQPNEAFTAALAVGAASSGRRTEARSALERLKGQGLSSLPSSSNWLVTLFGVAEAAALLGDAATAEEAYALLLPFADRPVMASLAVTCFGSVHRALGSAASAMGDQDLAVGHLEAACSADLRLGNAPSAVLASTRLAAVLRARDGENDALRATALEREAAEQTALLERAADASPAPAVLELVRAGRHWAVRADGRTATVRHSIGMAYLAMLISRQGVDVPATELVAGQEATVLAGRQDVLDGPAKAAYRRRAEELREEIDDAEAGADAGRAAKARLELEQLLGELGRAMGLSGRSRTFDDDAERARTSVQKAIRRALAAVLEADAVLGRRMEQSIVTGNRCAYLPATRHTDPVAPNRNRAVDT
jgi:hypothetical protein